MTTDRSAKASAAFLALCTVVIAGWFTLPVGPSRALLLVVLDAMAVGAIACGLAMHRPSALRPWLVLATAQLCSVAAFSYWYLYPSVSGVRLPSPSVADGLFLLLYGLACVGVALLVRAEGAGRNRRTLLDVLIVTSSLGVLSWVFLMAPHARAVDLAPEVRLLSLAYPALDLLLFVLAVRLVVSGATPSAAKWLLLAWSGCQLLADALYGLEVLGGRWTFSSPVPSLWMAAFAFVGAAALHPSIGQLTDPVSTEHERRRAVVLRTAIVVACASVLPAVLVVKLVQGDLAGLPVITAGSFMVFVLALLRGAVDTAGGQRPRGSGADRRSLARLVAGFVVLALLPLALLGITSVRLAEQALERDVLVRAETTASTSSALVERQLTGFGDLVSSYAERRLLASAMADGNASDPDEAAIERHLEQLRTASDGIRQTFLTDPTGRVTAVAPQVESLVGEDLSRQDWYDGVNRTGAPYVSNAYQSASTGSDPVTAVVAPVHDASGQTLGFIAAVYDLEMVQELSNELADAHGMALRITDRNGDLVAAPTASSEGRGSLVVDDRVAAALAGRSGVVTRESGDQAVISAYEPVPELGWTVTTEIPLSTAFASLQRLRPTVLGIATLLGQALLGGLVILVRSLRRRREVEQTLQGSEERTRAILDAAADAFLSMDGGGTITAWSEQAARLFGWQPDEVIGRPYDQVIPLSDRLRQTTLGERNEALVRHRNGTTFPVEFIMWVSGSGEDAVYSAFVHDISDRRRTEEEIADARDQALEASRMKSEFLAVMSHEIRTPMNGMLGMTSLLLSTELDAEQRDYAGTIRDSGEHLLELVNDVLDFSKVESGQLVLEEIDFSLRHVVRDVTDLLGVSAADRGIALSADIAAGVPPALRGDPGRLRQVLTNLVGNALKFTSTGSVALVVRPIEAAGSSDWLRFEVTDTGIGIADDVVHRLFEAFSQADASTTRTYGGTGLGLAISRQLVELLGGEIGVSSEVGVGSTFWFTVPLVEAAPLPDLPAVAPSMPPRWRHPSLVLVAEDNVVNQKIAVRMLEKLGHRADVAANGREAVEALRAVPYDLVLMDCQMPVMDGYHATEAIRAMQQASGRRTPVVAMTASAMDADRTRCLAAGMDDYLSKPVRLHDVAAALTTWLPTGSATNAPPLAPVPGSPPPSPPPERVDAVIDVAVIDNLRDLGAGFLARVVEMFQAGVPDRLTALRAAVEAADAPALVGITHGLRGTSGNLGGTGVAAICARMEAAAERGDMAAASTMVPDLEQALDALSVALTGYVVEPVR